MARKSSPGDVSIGKFDILATYAYAEALLHGTPDDEVKRLVKIPGSWGTKISGEEFQQRAGAYLPGTR